MKYDVIIAGAGPAGLAAARFAAEAGLKVIVFERKKEIAEVNRLCGQFTNINLVNVSGKMKYGYTEPLAFDIATDHTLIRFPALSFSIEYRGPLRAYQNYAYFSPGGNCVYRVRNQLFGFFCDKEALLKGLLEEALKAGVKVVNEAIVAGIEDTNSGVRVSVKRGQTEETYEARKLIAADGKESRIVEQLGLNKGRQVPAIQPMRALGYVMEGIETEHRLNTWVNFTVPSINPRANSWMYLQTGDTNIVGAGSGALAPAEAIEKLMKMPAFSDWFRKARIVKKVATAIGSTIMSPLMEPYIGNVIIIGDAAALIETTNPGAIACGYKAVTAVLDELKGKNGFAAYAAWWQRAFDTNDPDYLKAAGRNFSINLLCSDEEVNYLYGIVADKVGLPATLVAREMERVKAERPALFEKLNKAGVGVDVAGQKVDLTQVLSGKAGSSK